MSIIYVALTGNGPQFARTTLAEAQAAAEQAEGKYRDHPVDYRWDEETGVEGTRVWQLRVKGLSGRWAKAYWSVHQLPTA